MQKDLLYKCACVIVKNINRSHGYRVYICIPCATIAILLAIDNTRLLRRANTTRPKERCLPQNRLTKSARFSRAPWTGRTGRGIVQESCHPQTTRAVCRRRHVFDIHLFDWIISWTSFNRPWGWVGEQISIKKSPNVWDTKRPLLLTQEAVFLVQNSWSYSSTTRSKPYLSLLVPPPPFPKSVFCVKTVKVTCLFWNCIRRCKGYCSSWCRYGWVTFSFTCFQSFRKSHGDVGCWLSCVGIPWNLVKQTAKSNRDQTLTMSGMK